MVVGAGSATPQSFIVSLRNRYAITKQQHRLARRLHTLGQFHCAPGYYETVDIVLAHCRWLPRSSSLQCRRTLRLALTIVTD